MVITVRDVLFVPNAPCGVESWLDCDLGVFIKTVPNAPCGVERLLCAFYLDKPFRRS